jgi:hypothetical protein
LGGAGGRCGWEVLVGVLVEVGGPEKLAGAGGEAVLAGCQACSKARGGGGGKGAGCKPVLPLTDAPTRRAVTATSEPAAGLRLLTRMLVARWSSVCLSSAELDEHAQAVLDGAVRAGA